MIVAAGRSSRMRSPKALIELEGEAIIARLVRVFGEAGLDPIIVVASGPTLDAVKRLSGPIVLEGDGGRPMIDSIARAILCARSRGAAAAIVQPVDAPFTTVEMIRALTAGGASRSRVLSHGGSPGHPVFVAAHAFEAIIAEPQGGLRAVLADPEDPAELVEWDDERIFADLDTPEDLARWIGRTLH